MDRSKFVKKVMYAIKESGETRELVLDEGNFALKYAGDNSEGNVIGLSNVYDEYCAAHGKAKEEILKRFAQTVAGVKQMVDSLPKDFNAALPNLLPRVRQRSYYELLNMRMNQKTGKMNHFLYRPLADHFAVGLVYDTETAMMEPEESRFAEWKIGFDEALELATENLRKRSQPSFKEAVPGLYLSNWNDSHDCSRILLQDVIKTLDVKGCHVAMIPNRETLIVTGSEDDEGMLRMAHAANKVLEDPRPMSGIPLVLKGSKWDVFTPGENSPAYNDFLDLSIGTMAIEYEEQRNALYAQSMIDREDIVPVKFTMVRDEKTGKPGSVCMWMDGVVSLLPKTEIIAFMTGAPDNPHVAAMADWDRVYAICGGVMTPMGIYPERYRVEKFPSQEQLKVLGRGNG